MGQVRGGVGTRLGAAITPLLALSTSSGAVLQSVPAMHTRHAAIWGDPKIHPTKPPILLALLVLVADPDTLVASVPVRPREGYTDTDPRLPCERDTTGGEFHKHEIFCVPGSRKGARTS
eukprot:3363833-Rhodomonas_salina.1